MDVVARSRGAAGPRAADVRRGNVATLLRHLHVHGSTSRAQLTRLLSLNRSTIGDLTADLAGVGLVREEVGRPAGHSTGGRPSHVVVPQTEQAQVLAIDIGVSHLTVARVGLGGRVLDRRDLFDSRAPGDGAPREVADVVDTISGAARELLHGMGAASTCVGAGVAVPGMVRAPDGLVRQVPNLGWVDVPMGAALSEALGLPVSVGNDADLGGLAEHVRGAAVGCDDVVYLAGHAGIGAGVFVAGQALAGHRGYAGEVGHMVVNPRGVDCRCGSRGCWETEASEERLLELAGRSAGGGLPAVREVVAAAAAGEPAATEALRHVASWLGIGTAGVVNIFNPEVVILGGALAEVYSAAEPLVRTSLDGAVLAPPGEDLRLVLPAFGVDSALLGAAELAFGPLLADPLQEMARLAAS